MIVDEQVTSTIGIRKELEILTRINEVAKSINSTLELPEIIDAAIRELPKLLNANKCSLFLYNPTSEELTMAAHNHYDLDQNLDLRISIHSSQLLGQAVKQGRSILIRDIEKEFGLKNRSKYKSKSSMITLLQSGDKLLGVININDKIDGTEFDEWDFSIALNINEHLATAISNAQLFAQTRRLSITDGLTDLYNHRYFQETLEREVVRSNRYHKPLALLMLDIDFFKKVNDTYGHLSGDMVLQSISNLLKNLLRRSDLPCRYGGEEIAVILTDTDFKNAILTAERIRQAVEQLEIVNEGGSVIRITVSIGVTAYVPNLSKQKMIEQADLALYEAKHSGRNRVCSRETTEGPRA